MQRLSETDYHSQPLAGLAHAVRLATQQLNELSLVLALDKERLLTMRSLSESLITIALLLGLAFGVSWALRTWLLSVQGETATRIERASY